MRGKVLGQGDRRWLRSVPIINLDDPLKYRCARSSPNRKIACFELARGSALEWLRRPEIETKAPHSTPLRSGLIRQPDTRACVKSAVGIDFDGFAVT